MRTTNNPQIEKYLSIQADEEFLIQDIWREIETS
jgi:hypothetical protein